MTDIEVHVQASVSIRAEDHTRSSVLTAIATSVMDAATRSNREDAGITACEQINVESGYFWASVTVSNAADEEEAVSAAARDLRVALAAQAELGRQTDGLVSFKVDENSFSVEPAMKIAI